MADTLQNDGRDAGSARGRKIIHIDMDAFFASVEQRDNPALRGKPVAVGGAQDRGVVAAASYEARKFGVRSAMPSAIAKRKCPDLIFVKPRFEVYREVSSHIRDIFGRHTRLIEPVSLDEAYLDVTENFLAIPSATRIAEIIRETIRAETNLTASAGVSYNKFLAKLASDYRKPDGLFIITPERGASFVEALEVGRIHGVGPATTAKMNRLGIMTGADLRERSLAFLQKEFGKSGSFFYWIARGVDERPVRADRIRKSLGGEQTFSRDLMAFDEACAALAPIIEKVWRGCEKARLRGRTVTLKVKYADFRQKTRAHTGVSLISRQDELANVALRLLAPMFPLQKGIRLLGVSVSNFDSAAHPHLDQLTLKL